MIPKILSITNDDEIQKITVTPDLQSRIISCLFDDRQYPPIQDVILRVALAVKDIAPELLSRIYVTGRTFTSNAVISVFNQEINRLLAEQKEALCIQRIEVKRLDNYTHSVIEGMKIIGEHGIQVKSRQWIDLHG